MALANWALITEAEARQELKLPAEATVDTASLWAVIELCTAQIEAHLRRRIRNRAVEFTDIVNFRREDGFSELLYTLDRPIFTITSIKESDSHTSGDVWATITALTEGVDYIASKGRGRIERLEGGWSNELRAAEAEWYPSGIVSGSGGTRGPAWKRWVQVKYYAGFEGQDGAPTAAEALPPIFSQVCRELVALKWREIQRGMQGVSGVTDETGSFSRFGAAKLTADMVAALADEHRIEQSCNVERAVNY